MLMILLLGIASSLPLCPCPISGKYVTLSVLYFIWPSIDHPMANLKCFEGHNMNISDLHMWMHDLSLFILFSKVFYLFTDQSGSIMYKKVPMGVPMLRMLYSSMERHFGEFWLWARAWAQLSPGSAQKWAWAELRHFLGSGSPKPGSSSSLRPGSAQHITICSFSNVGKMTGNFSYWKANNNIKVV